MSSAESDRRPERSKKETFRAIRQTARAESWPGRILLSCPVCHFRSLSTLLSSSMALRSSLSSSDMPSSRLPREAPSGSED